MLSVKSNIDSLLYCLPGEKFFTMARSDPSHNEIVRYLVDEMRGGKGLEMLALLCFVCN
jgi:hypothetical protein